MDEATATEINHHLGMAFNHLQEAIMLALAGAPAGGALGRLERFIASGDTDILTEGMTDEPISIEEMEAAAADLSGILSDDSETLFDEGPFVNAEPLDPDKDNQGQPTTQEVEGTGLSTDLDPDDEESEFDGLFDDINEDDDVEPGDAPAAF